MDKSVYCTVRWSNHSNNVNRFLSVSYAEEKYTDVALACEGHLLKAHKIILAGCSPYFENMFSMYSVPNLCVAVEGIAYPILQLVLEFMYSGEIRVKHSELENLVKAGVQLKVKGLDAIKLNDLTRGAERTTVIARPTDNSPKLVKVPRPPVTPPSSSVSNLAQKLPDPVVKSSTKRIEPSPQDRSKLVQKPINLYGLQPGATSTSLLKPKQEPVKTSQENSKSPDPSAVSKASAENHKSDKESPISSPSKPATSSSESKKKVGQWLDSLKLAEKKEKTEEVHPRQTRKRAAKPRAPCAVKEPKITRALKRLQGSNGVEREEEPQEKEQEDVQDPTSLLSPPKESAVDETNSNLEKPTEKREQKDITPVSTEVEAVIHSDKPHQNEEEPTDLPQITKNSESFNPEKGEILTTRSRTIKKPARLADAFEPEFVLTKKRRSRKADGGEESSRGETSSAAEIKTSFTKRRNPSAFVSFCYEFRQKLMEEYPGETHKEISKRLGLLWKNLDQATKCKYTVPDSIPITNE